MKALRKILRKESSYYYCIFSTRFKDLEFGIELCFSYKWKNIEMSNVELNLETL